MKIFYFLVYSYKGYESGFFFIKSCVSLDDEYFFIGFIDEMVYIYKVRDFY